MNPRVAQWAAARTRTVGNRCGSLADVRTCAVGRSERSLSGGRHGYGGQLPDEQRLSHALVTPFAIAIGHCAFVKDPFGNTLGLLNMTEGPLPQRLGISSGEAPKDAHLSPQVATARHRCRTPEHVP